MKFVKFAFTTPVIAMSVTLCAALSVFAEDVTVNVGDSIEDAILRAGESGTITLKTGTHYISQQAELLIENAVTIVGETGDPKDVIVTRPAADDTAKIGYRIFHLNNAGAKIKDLTAQGGRFWKDATAQNGCCVRVDNGMVEHCILENSDTTGDDKYHIGGGFYLNAGRVTRSIIRNNKVHTNNGNCQAAGAYLQGGQVDNCLFIGNDGCNGTIVINNTAVRVYNCTLVDNVSKDFPGFKMNAKGLVYNTISMNNSTPKTDAASQLYNQYPECFKGCFTAQPTTADNVSGVLLAKAPATGDYRPMIGSDNIDNVKALDVGWTDGDLDLQGNPRIVNGIADIGCYEWASASAGAELTLTAAQAKGPAPFVAPLKANVNGLVAPLSYNWDFGDGGTDTTAEPEAWHTYETSGKYTVRLTVVDGAQVPHEANACFVIASGSTVMVDGKAVQLEDALDIVADGGEVVLKASGSPYSLSGQVALTRPVTVRGETGRPEDVVVTRPANTGNKTPYRIFNLNNEFAVVRDLTIDKGSLDGDPYALNGAGVCIEGEGGTVSNCVIRNSSATGHSGGGVSMLTAKALVTHCVISNNVLALSSGYNYGGGAYISAGRLDNCLLYKNGGRQGGGLYVASANTKVYNCDLIGNYSGDNTGAIHFNDRNAKVVNCIVTSDNTGKSAEMGVYNDKVNAAACMTYCVVPEAVRGNLGETCVYGEPDFTAKDKMDFTTSKNSCNVGKGDNTVPAFTAEDTDLGGNPRLAADGKIDIGCYQWTLSGIEVSFDVSSTSGILPLKVDFTAHAEGATGEVVYKWDFDGDGVIDETSGFPQASHTYTAAATSAANLIVNCNGVDYPASSTKTIRAYPGSITVDPAEGIQAAVNAGGDGSVVTIPTGDYTLATTVELTSGLTLRGETGKPGDVRLKSVSAQVLHVNHAGALVTGLTVCDSSSSGVQGIFIDANGGTVSNCVVRNVTAPDGRQSGCPVYLSAGLMTHCVIADNAGYANGYARYGGCGVTAVCLAGGILANSLVSGNHLVGEVTSGTEGDYAMGTIAIRSDASKVVNCTVVDNTAVCCGGIFAEAGEVVNCLIAGNTSLSRGDEAGVYLGVVDSFDHCAADAVKINDSCLMGDPCFIAPTRGIYRIGGKSVAVDAGSDGVALPAVDVGGRPRLVGKAVDIGCYENQGGFQVLVR